MANRLRVAGSAAHRPLSWALERATMCLMSVWGNNYTCSASGGPE